MGSGEVDDGLIFQQTIMIKMDLFDFFADWSESFVVSDFPG